MKKILLLASLFSMLGVNAQQTTTKEAFIEKWKNSKTYLIEMAEVMPDSLYDFKPTERQMSFKEQLLHIKGNMDWLSTSYFTASELDRSKRSQPTTKEGTITLLQDAFDATIEIIEATSEETLKDTVAFFSGPKSKLQILNLLQDHVTHHRGQLVVYLNLNNIEPPKYIGW